MSRTVHQIRRGVHVFALITALCVFLGTGEASASTKGWLAFGDLRGSLEPCGCDPTTDLGGIKRIITAVGRERILKPNVGVFCLGNTFDPVDRNEIKKDFLLRGLALVKPDATLFNHAELSSMGWFDRSFSRSKASILAQNFVLSNVKKKESRFWISEVVRTNDFLVFGYVFGPELKGKVEPLSDALLIRWRGLLRPKDASKKKILLFSGPAMDLEILKNAGLFDSIISSHTAPMGEIPSTKDKDDESRLARQQKGGANQEIVWMVPLAGQGYLRGGDLLNREGATLGDVFSQAESAVSSAGARGSQDLNKVLNRPQNFSWLLPQVGENRPSQVLYEEYMRAIKKAFDVEAEKRVRDLKASPFAGVESCTTCHPSEVERFRQTKHAHAMETLVKKGKEQDPECVVCHSVGAREKGGFVSLKHSPALAGVQCENCHGPRQAHVQKPMNSAKSKGDSFKVCVGCHNSQHSPRFNQKEYWSNIEHGPKSGLKTQEKSDP